MAEQALERARTSHRKTLPVVATTPGHHVCRIEDAGTAETVRAVWWGVDREGQPARGFVSPVIVVSVERPKGYATGALQVVEEQARRLGLAAVGLHGFATRPEAIRFYQRLGCQTASLNLLKVIQG